MHMSKCVLFASFVFVTAHTVGQGFTCLHHAAGGGHPECFHCLLEHSADASVCTLGGDNALDVARKRGKPRIIGKASKVNQCSYMYVLTVHKMDHRKFYSNYPRIHIHVC